MQTYRRGHIAWQHELLLYGWVDGAASTWRGGYGVTSFWEIDRPTSRRGHPTAKPVELMARPIRYSTPDGGVVLDPSSGGGSTLLAAQQLGRIGVGIEMDPGYARGH